MTDAATPRIAVWLQPEQARFVHQAAAAAGVAIAWAGAPGAGRSAEVAAELGAIPVGDVRALFVQAHPPVEPAAGAEDDHAVHAIWLATSGDVRGGEDPSLLAAIRSCVARGVDVLSSEPMPGSMLGFGASIDRPLVAGSGDTDLTSVSGDAARPSSTTVWPEFIPRWRHAPSMVDLHDCLHDFGSVGTVSLRHLGWWTSGTAGARLVDALDVAASIMGEAEEVYAAYAPVAGAAMPGHGISGAAGGGGAIEDVRDLRGTLSVILRFSDGRSASVLVSDAAGAWERSISIIGDGSQERGGRIVVASGALAWFGRDGSTLEQPRPAKRIKKSAAVDEGVSVVAGALARSLRDDSRRAGRVGRAYPSVPPMNQVSVLSMAGAALLSVTTGEPESPRTIKRMVLVE